MVVSFELTGYAKAAINSIKVKFGTSPTCGTLDGLAAIRLYSGDFMYHVVNSSLRAVDRSKLTLLPILPFL